MTAAFCSTPEKWIKGPLTKCCWVDGWWYFCLVWFLFILFYPIKLTFLAVKEHFKATRYDLSKSGSGSTEPTRIHIQLKSMIDDILCFWKIFKYDLYWQWMTSTECFPWDFYYCCLQQHEGLKGTTKQRILNELFKNRACLMHMVETTGKWLWICNN